MKRNIKLVIAYDGTRYNGWQKQGNTENTIQGKLERVLSGILEEDIELQGSGRTDAGVHAKAQVANFHTSSDVSLEDISTGFTMYLPNDIAVYHLEEVPPRFHSRLNATSKCYQYRIWNSHIPNVFEHRYLYEVEQPLNVEAMQQAAKKFEGTHDFKGFCSNKRMKKSTVRTIYSIEIEQKREEITLKFEGNGFLYNMVRILTGTLIEVGLGKRKPEEMEALIASKDREEAGFTAPAQGLCLKSVSYEARNEIDRK